VRERSAAALWREGSGLSFDLIHSRSRRFTGDHGPPACAGHGRWWTPV